MSAEIITVLAILVAVIILLVTEWAPLEVLAMLVMGLLAVTGIVTPKEALAGFSNPDQIHEMNHWGQLLAEGGPIGPEALFTHGMQVATLRIKSGSAVEQQTLSGIGFRNRFGLNVLCIDRDGRRMNEDLKGRALRGGDILLVHGPSEKLNDLGDQTQFKPPEILSADDVMHRMDLNDRLRRLRVPAASKLVGLSLSESRLGDAVDVQILFIIRSDGTALIPTSADGFEADDQLIVSGAADMVLTRCLTMDEAYRYIEWKAVFLIAGMLPLGMALDNTGAARLLAEGVVGVVGPYGPYAVLVGLMVITFIATSIIPTAALVVLMVPIALKTAASLGVSPYSLMMGIAMAASSSFTSPISHPANVLVMGPGGYRFIDYVKLGLPLTLVVLIILMIVIPLFWPV